MIQPNPGAQSRYLDISSPHFPQVRLGQSEKAGMPSRARAESRKVTSVVLGWVMECAGIAHEQLCMWMVLPNQTGGLQGHHHVNGDGLAVEMLGIGPGWQQNRQNWLPPAVMGDWT